MHTLIAPAINFFILIGLLVYFLRQPLADFVRSRHETTRDELSRVADQLKSAQEKYDEFTAKLKAMQAEIGILREQARQDGEAIRLKLVADGRRVSATVVADAKEAAVALQEEVRLDLRRELALRVVSRAETMIRSRLTSEDRVRIRGDFVHDLEALAQ